MLPERCKISLVSIFMYPIFVKRLWSFSQKDGQKALYKIILIQQGPDKMIQIARECESEARAVCQVFPMQRDKSAFCFIEWFMYSNLRLNRNRFYKMSLFKMSVSKKIALFPTLPQDHHGICNSEIQPSTIMYLLKHHIKFKNKLRKCNYIPLVGLRVDN